MSCIKKTWFKSYIHYKIRLYIDVWYVGNVRYCKIRITWNNSYLHRHALGKHKNSRHVEDSSTCKGHVHRWLYLVIAGLMAAVLKTRSTIAKGREWEGNYGGDIGEGEISIASTSHWWKGWICAATSAQGCNDADAGFTGIRNRGRNARTPFRFVSRVEDAFTHGWPLGPYLPTVVAAESSRSSFHLLRCLLFVSRRVHRHASSRADFILVRITTEVLSAWPGTTIRASSSILKVSHETYVTLNIFFMNFLL